jgi:hypothetical protein
LSLHPPESRRHVAVSTGTGKTHLAIAIARSCIRAGSRGRFFNTVDLVNRLEAESRSGRQSRLADYLTRLDFVILDSCAVRIYVELPDLDAGFARLSGDLSSDCST